MGLTGSHYHPLPLLSRTVVWILNKPTVCSSFDDRYWLSSGKGIYGSPWEIQAEGGIRGRYFSTFSVMTGA